MIDDTIKKDTEVKESVISEPKAEPEVTDIDLGFVEKKKFRINGDFNRMLELNVSDLNITQRLKVDYPKLKSLLAEAQDKITNLPEDEDSEKVLGEFADTLTDIDNKMRTLIDHIFDTNASEVCAPTGNMFDPVGGQWRFERIIDKLTTLYTNGLNAEFNQIKNRVESKTSKYIKKSKK